MQWSGTNTREKLATIGTFFIFIIIVRLFALENMPLLNSFFFFCHKLSLVFKSSVTRNRFQCLLQWGIVIRFHRNIFIIDYVASESWSVSKDKRRNRGEPNHNLFSPPTLSLFICSRPNFLNEPARKLLLLRLSLLETYTNNKSILIRSVKFRSVLLKPSIELYPIRMCVFCPQAGPSL